MQAVVLQRPKELAVEAFADPVLEPGKVLVRISRGGICGSDLHYFHDGGFGTVRMSEPMILGHEICGRVAALGAGVSGIAIGDAVAIDPSKACGQCEFCRAGRPRHCSDMRFMGSAMRKPPVQGGFCEWVVCEAERAVPFAGPDIAEAAFCEPLAVCLHAVAQAGTVEGARVAVAGLGPIGCLTLLGARHRGASEIVALDVAAPTLRMAERIGASRTINLSVAKERDALGEYAAGRGTFDVAFECSGHPQSLANCLNLVRPGGTIVQVGIYPDEVTAPLNIAVVKEITYRGTFRFDREFVEAAELIGRRAIDVRPLLSEVLPYADAVAAFALAGDKSKAMKVQLAFAE